MKPIFPAVFCLSILLMSGCQPDKHGFRHLKPEEVREHLHVPSPAHWEDQIIYFLMTDRFADGDSTNNDFGQGEYDPQKDSHWNGGDLKGITDHLAYIKNLGATAIWITPPVANQWINPQRTFTGYHGYWADHMMEVDAHYGSLADYQMLSATLHANDMYLVQDVVVNHMGDYFTYQGAYDPENVVQNFVRLDNNAPRQKPFDQNNALDPAQREKAIYHWTPEIQDFADKEQKLIYTLADLDDLNTSHPEVRKTLKESLNYWIKEAGVDGFRYDTPLYVEHEFFHDHFHGENGIIPFAEAEGKNDFITFGETWVAASPMEDDADREAEKYIGSKEKPEMSSILNFPLHQSAKRVFAESAPTAWLSYRMQAQQEVFDRPDRLFNFIDNHDMQRMRAGASYEAVQQNLLFYMTTPGIPVIYYGTEQEFIPTRQAMFAEGFAADGKDHFNEDHRAFRFLQELIAMRKNSPVFSRGDLKLVADDPNGAGLFAYELSYEGENRLVIFNTSGEKRLVSDLPVQWAESGNMKVAFRLKEGPGSLTLGSDQKLSLVLEARDAVVLERGSGEAVPKEANGNLELITVRQDAEGLVVAGKSPANEKLRLMIDGKIDLATETTADEDGVFQAELPLGLYPNGRHELSVVMEQDGLFRVAKQAVEWTLPQQKLLNYQDPRGDDHGPESSYQYPSHPSFDGQMDIVEVELSATGQNLQIDVRMAVPLSTIWLPPNGFDHVNLAVYIDLPAEKGVNAMPFRFAEVPEGMDWDRMISATGWSCNFFSSEGAGPKNQGSAITPGAKLSVLSEAQTIRFNLPAAALAYPESLEGIKIYVASWDGGGETDLRPLKAKAEAYSFGGGGPEDPRIMDDTGVLLLQK